MLWINLSSSSTGSGVSWATAMLPKNSENGNQPTKMVSKMPTKGKKSPKFGVTVLHPKCFPAANARMSLVHKAVKYWNILPLRPELTKQQIL